MESHYVSYVVNAHTTKQLAAHKMVCCFENELAKWHETHKLLLFLVERALMYKGT